MAKEQMKLIMMAVRKAMPDTLTYVQKCVILEKLADEYRAKSRKEIGDEVAKFKLQKHNAAKG